VEIPLVVKCCGYDAAAVVEMSWTDKMQMTTGRMVVTEMENECRQKQQPPPQRLPNCVKVLSENLNMSLQQPQRIHEDADEMEDNGGNRTMRGMAGNVLLLRQQQLNKQRDELLLQKAVEIQVDKDDGYQKLQQRPLLLQQLIGLIH
jgi:hypothetical protein